MTDEPARVTVRISDEGSDEHHLEELTSRLRAELRDLHVPVAQATAGEAPPGTRSIELAALGTLIVTLSGSPVLAAVVNAISNWLGQRRQRSVRLEIDGDVLEMSGQPTAEQQRLTEVWLGRHAATKDTGIAGRHALIIANYDYRDPGLQQLRAPAHDARRLAAVLRDPKVGGFTVRTLLNESAATINEAVEDLFAERDPDDLLVLHYSGHGIKDDTGELYLAATGTKLNRLGATAVSADFVNRRMNRSRSRRIVLLLDCCYSGAVGRGMVPRAGGNIAVSEQFSGHGRAIITASSAMEYAFEGQELKEAADGGPSVFTSALVQGLESGEADLDQDGHVGLDELYDYVYAQVRRSTPKQTPGKWTFDLQGELRIARRGKPVSKPTPLPAELQEAVDHPISSVREGSIGELARLANARHEGLALAATLALQRLLHDDSRKVAAAAAEALWIVEPEPKIPEPVPALPDPGPVKPGHPVVDSTESVAVTSPAVDVVPAPGPEHPSPQPPGASNGAWWVRVLAGIAAVVTAVGYATWTASSGSDTVLLALPFFYSVLVAAAVGGALVLTVAPSGRRERTLAPGLMMGAVVAPLGLLVAYAPDEPSQVLPVGLLLIALVAVLGSGTSRFTWRAGVNLVCGAVAVFAVAVEVLIPHIGDKLERNSIEVLAAAVLLLWVAVLVFLRWRRGDATWATWFGAAATALLLTSVAWGLGMSGQVPNSEMFVVPMLLVLLIDAVIDEEDAGRLAIARLTLIAGLLLQAPRYAALPDASSSAAWHVVLGLGAAALALAAYYVRPPGGLRSEQ